MPHASLSDGRRVYYERAASGSLGGSGTTLLMLHGIGSSSASFRRQLEGLAEECDAIAWDAPGYGRSDDPSNSFEVATVADDAVALLDCLGVEHCDVLGHSMGGVVALLANKRHPDRVRSLILSDTIPGTGSLGPIESRARVRARLEAIANLTPRELADRRAPRTVSADAPTDLVREIADVMAEIRPRIYAEAAVSLGGTDLTDVLPMIHVPVLVMCGEHDTTVTPGAAAAMARAIPSATYVEIPGAGHASNQENPVAYNTAVRRFLERVSRLAGTTA